MTTLSVCSKQYAVGSAFGPIPHCPLPTANWNAAAHCSLGLSHCQLPPLPTAHWTNTADITRNRGIFECVKDRAFRADFYAALNELMRSLEYKVVACAIRKQAHLAAYGVATLDPYMLSLDILVERFCFEIGNTAGGVPGLHHSVRLYHLRCAGTFSVRICPDMSRCPDPPQLTLIAHSCTSQCPPLAGPIRLSTPLCFRFCMCLMTADSLMPSAAASWR